MKPVNPLKQMRKSHNLTQSTLAERAGVGPLLIIRAEQGVYVNPPPALLNYLLDLTGESEITVLRNYHSFQKQTRTANYGELWTGMDWVKWGFSDPITNERVPANPLILWRNLSGLNPTEVAKLYCIHPVAIHKVEKQPHLANTIPSQIINALKEAGYSYELLGHFQTAFVNYKDYLRTLVTSEAS